MHKIKFQTSPKIFQNKFPKPTHKYPSNFSTSNYSIPPFKSNKSKYIISNRGPTLWKNIPINPEKMQETVTVFKNSVTKKLLELQNETSCFYIKLLKKLKHECQLPKCAF